MAAAVYSIPVLLIFYVVCCIVVGDASGCLQHICPNRCGWVGMDGFILACEASRKGSTSHSPPLLFFLKWKSARVHQFRSSGEDRSTAA